MENYENKNSPLLSIVMPCLNEEKTIAFCIQEAQQFFKKSGIDGEIIIADNESYDRSQEIARSLGARVIPIHERGYGNALKGGIAQAYGKYVIMGDCDGSYDFLHLEEFIEKLDEGYDLVMGDRLNQTMEKGAMPFMHKYLGVPFLSWLGRVVYHTSIHDFHCGIRGFRKESILNLHLKSTGMEYASEMIGESVKAHLKITEIPVTLRKDKRDKRSHMRPIRDGLRHVIWILRSR